MCAFYLPEYLSGGVLSLFEALGSPVRSPRHSIIDDLVLRIQTHGRTRSRVICYSSHQGSVVQEIGLAECIVFRHTSLFYNLGTSDC